MPESADVRAKKDELRSRMRAERSALSAEAVGVASEAVCRHVLALAPVAGAATVAVYAAVRGEISPARAAGELAARGATVVYPRADGPRLRFHLAGPLLPGAFGIPEPPSEAPEVAIETADVVLVPGLAFDRAGHRLGYGRGYYDALLASAPRALRIGLCHSFQWVDALPRREGDEPVDLIVTPDGAHATSARSAFAPKEVLT